MNINLKRFVDINIQQRVISATVGTRDTFVLFSDEYDGDPIIVSSYSEAEANFASFATLLQYCEVYFDNNGVKLLVIGLDYTSITNEVLSELSDDYIGFAVCSTSAVSTVYSAIKAIMSARQNDADVYGINEKIYFVRTETLNSDSIKNVCMKYSKVVGAEMTMCAYLSRININSATSVFDYSFTAETIEEEDVTDETFSQLNSNNINVDTYLANAVRNIGGNNKDGADMTNNYVRIMLHQSLTEELIELLSQKIKDSSGLSKIYAVITKDLERYKTCGYLSLDKIWTNEDLIVTYNNTQYTIISKGTSLSNGYYVRVLPLSSLTEEDKQNRKSPPVYVILADQYGIRQITVQGEVI